MLLTVKSSKCSVACDSGEVAEIIGGVQKCVTCDYGCNECTSATVCTACNYGYVINDNSCKKCSQFCYECDLSGAC